MSRMTKLLLTGAAGFIGAHTLQHFFEKTDWDLIGVDSLEHHGDYRRIEQVLSKNPEWKQRFRFIQKDLAKLKPPNFAKRIGKVDHIINMASESHVDRSISDPVPFIKNNVDLTLMMLEVARITKPETFIQISTDEVYGPMYDEPYVEWSTAIPSNPYSASKAAQESIAIAYWRTYGVPVIITNTMNNIGEMQDVEKFVPMLIRDTLAGKPAKVHGTQHAIGTRYYLHARNHADALLFILKTQPPKPYWPEKGYIKPDRYNIVGDARVSNLEMAGMVAKILGKPLKYHLIDFHTTRPGHDMHYGLNGDKLRELGWQQPLGFEESLKTTVENYMKHPYWLEWTPDNANEKFTGHK